MRPNTKPHATNHGTPDADLRVDHPETAVSLPETSTTKTARVTHSGGEYTADYGPDPVHNAGPVNAIASDGGSTWNISRGAGRSSRSFGFSYLSGYWQLFETERTRTITWGGVVRSAGRSVPPTDGLPERDQIFVFDGEANVGAKGATSEQATKIGKGYYVTATTTDGTVSLSEPKPIPTKGMQNPPPDAEDILAFLGAIKAANPDASL